jgi:hypothetical protein
MRDRCIGSEQRASASSLSAQLASSASLGQLRLASSASLAISARFETHQGQGSHVAPRADDQLHAEPLRSLVQGQSQSRFLRRGPDAAHVAVCVWACGRFSRMPLSATAAGRSRPHKQRSVSPSGPRNPTQVTPCSRTHLSVKSSSCSHCRSVSPCVRQCKTHGPARPPAQPVAPTAGSTCGRRTAWLTSPHSRAHARAEPTKNCGCKTRLPPSPRGPAAPSRPAHLSRSRHKTALGARCHAVSSSSQRPSSKAAAPPWQPRFPPPLHQRSS